MRFSLFAALSGLAALAVVSALPTDVPSVDVNESIGALPGHWNVSLISRLTTDMHSST